MTRSKEMQDWLDKLKYLPEELRDFSDYAKMFQAMHFKIANADSNPDINHRTGCIYVVDTFLWYMASRGYTLQRCRKNFEYQDIDKDIQDMRDFTRKQFNQMLNNAKENKL